MLDLPVSHSCCFFLNFLTIPIYHLTKDWTKMKNYFNGCPSISSITAHPMAVGSSGQNALNVTIFDNPI